MENMKNVENLVESLVKGQNMKRNSWDTKGTKILIVFSIFKIWWIYVNSISILGLLLFLIVNKFIFNVNKHKSITKFYGFLKI